MQRDKREISFRYRPRDLAKIIVYGVALSEKLLFSFSSPSNTQSITLQGDSMLVYSGIWLREIQFEKKFIGCEEALSNDFVEIAKICYLACRTVFHN